MSNLSSGLSGVNCDEHGELPGEPLTVTFFPQLHLQRQAWILNLLRREAVKEMLDVGCGEGSILSSLSNPAFCLAPIGEDHEEVKSLHCSRIMGLDISEVDLNFTVERTAPPPAGASEPPRWEPLNVKIWRGGLESYNEEFAGIECIVATEVIEHLTPEIEKEFAPMLLGVYRPRLLFLTTPNYSFNARWTPPGIHEREGYPDPTGRTDRVFRHSDHKFEWTIQEFRVWCEAAAHEWGYKVDVSSVGRAREPDPWGRENELQGATSIAEFIRQDEKRMEAGPALAAIQRARQRPPHTLLADHHHDVDLLARHPAPADKIADAIREKMTSWREMIVGLQDLWFERDISTLCGGWQEKLVEAIEADPNLEIHTGESKWWNHWKIGLVGRLEEDMEAWQPESVGNVSVDPFDTLVNEDGEDEDGIMYEDGEMHEEKTVDIIKEDSDEGDELKNWSDGDVRDWQNSDHWEDTSGSGWQSRS